MGTDVTQGIRVEVRPRFEPAHSDVPLGRCIFSYRVRIVNEGSRPVKLLRRLWHIHDGLAPVREVEGPGVVGETPVIAPGERYTYESFCDLRSGQGRMHGSYLMSRLPDDHFFEVRIPEFHLELPWLAN